jgi:GDP-L-fucose synthase
MPGSKINILMEKNSKIYVAGHAGLVGSALVRALKAAGFTAIVTRSHSELDLCDETQVNNFFTEQRPDYVFLVAAKVGGILANRDNPVDFLTQNLKIQSNVITAAHNFDVKKLLFLGSSCIYPKFAPQPIKEDSLLTGALEPSNEAYAIAKIAGIKHCQYLMTQYGKKFISAMPTNLFGVNDNYDLQTSHVLPALIRKYHTAKVTGSMTVELWGTGTPLREFMHVDDLAAACLFLMENYDGVSHVNVGTGEDLPIRELARLVQEIVGFEGETVWDQSKPDGTPRKLMDVSLIHSLGWKHQIGLVEGIKRVYDEVDKSGWV